VSPVNRSDSFVRRTPQTYVQTPLNRLNMLIIFASAEVSSIWLPRARIIYSAGTPSRQMPADTGGMRKP